MFRFDHGANRQGVGDRPASCRPVSHRSVPPWMDTPRHRRFTGPANAGYAVALRRGRENQMSDW